MGEEFRVIDVPGTGGIMITIANKDSTTSIVINDRKTIENIVSMCNAWVRQRDNPKNALIVEHYLTLVWPVVITQHLSTGGDPFYRATISELPGCSVDDFDVDSLMHRLELRRREVITQMYNDNVEIKGGMPLGYHQRER